MAHPPLVRLQLPARWAVCSNAFGEEEMVVDGWIENNQYGHEQGNTRHRWP
ncbi:hypothetical protein [Hymenobacter sp. YC55]|uniref:hypothetical protein n=1 Tax=Hymenobacter sp. YC55 TaxID=3034019 RepID=UPI0023F8B49A|nr:hypothetical protein [Hymenobacter sp. YC55]MDF7813792.1 hypothetical protein [Hymenobacter sp. YC55]